MQQYQWAVKVTMQYLDGHGGVDPAIRECGSEREARARHEAIQDTLARPGRSHSK